MTTPLPPIGGFQKCGKPDCMRKVKHGVAFCCSPCGIAADGRYEIHEHSNWCNERAAERGECTPYEALALAQRGTPAPLRPPTPTDRSGL